MKSIEEAVAKITELNGAVKAAEEREAKRDAALKEQLAAVTTELDALKANSGLPDESFAQLEEALALVNADAAPVVDPGETQVPPAEG